MNKANKMSVLELNSPLVDAKAIGIQPKRVQIGQDFVTLYRHKDQFFLADDRCRHRGARLDEATVCESAELQCPYHGKKTKARHILIEKYGFLWMKDPSSFFEEVPVDFLFCGSREILLPAPFHVVVDNFNEGSHTPFVHKFLGPESSDLSQTEFSWESLKEFVHIKYKTNQKKNFLFYGFNKSRDIDWIIDWKTYVKPLYMRYYSEWIERKSKEKIIEKNMTFFFLVPKGTKETAIVSFVFVQPLSWLRFVPWLTKKVSMFMTNNQIREDQRFYKKINDLPESLSGLELDQYDQPLIEIRKRASDFYPNFILSDKNWPL